MAKKNREFVMILIDGKIDLPQDQLLLKQSKLIQFLGFFLRRPYNNSKNLDFLAFLIVYGYMAFLSYGLLNSGFRVILLNNYQAFLSYGLLNSGFFAVRL